MYIFSAKTGILVLKSGDHPLLIVKNVAFTRIFLVGTVIDFI